MIFDSFTYPICIAVGGYSDVNLTNRAGGLLTKRRTPVPGLSITSVYNVNHILPQQFALLSIYLFHLFEDFYRMMKNLWTVKHRWEQKEYTSYRCSSVSCHL